MSASISVSEWVEFNSRWLKKEFPDQRFGQAFCNEFNITNPEIFYEDNGWEVIAKCKVYVDEDVIGANRKDRNRAIVSKEKLDKIIQPE